MVRTAVAVLLLCASSASAAEPDPAGDDVTVLDRDPSNDLTLDAAFEMGVLSRTHGTITAGYARRLWGRGYVEARLGMGVAEDLLVLEARGGVGLVLRPGERIEALIGWRVGDTYLRGSLQGSPYRIHLLAVELAIALHVRIADAWRLRALPLVPTLFWNGTYSGALGLELGVSRAF